MHTGGIVGARRPVGGVLRLGWWLRSPRPAPITRLARYASHQLLRLPPGRLALYLFVLLLVVGCTNEQADEPGAVGMETEAEVVAVEEAEPGVGVELATEGEVEPEVAVVEVEEPPGPTPTATLEPGMFVNPVIDQDFPDPDLLKVNDTYYAYATNSGNRNIQAARSTDLVHWEMLRDALPSLPDWAALDFGYVWAPEVTMNDDGEYVMYFTARYKMGEAGGRQCIGVATSAVPEGPFKPVGEEPFICQLDEGGSIDASAFVDEDGTRYVLWKNDGNCCAIPTWLYIQEVSDDGLMREGEPVRLITRDQSWEGPLVEAPTLWQDDGKYYLFYSANDYASPQYAVGYAVAEDIFGPYEKAAQPLLETSIKDGTVGPGGQDVVLDPDGDPWIVYHAWAPGGYRNMNIDELVWEEGVVEVLGPDREPQPVP